MHAVFFFSCASEPEIFLIKSEISHSKPQDSNEFIEGKKVEYQLWFNSGKWRILDPDSAIYKKLAKTLKKPGESLGDLLVHNSDNVLGLLLEEPTPIPLKNAVHNFNKWTMAKGDRIVSQELRTINNNEVLFIQSFGGNANIRSIKLYYYLTNKTGTVAIYVYTTPQLFATYESDIFDLLNGLVDANSTQTNSDK
jgi:hypothetical protein